jgi:hypothetical protein
MLRTAVDAVEAEHKRDEAIRSAAKAVSDAVLHLTHRMDAYIARREEQRKADEEQAEREEQEEIQRTLDALPDPDDPDQFVPTGDLHELPATDPQEQEPDPQEQQPDDQGLEGVIATRPITDPEELAHAPKPQVQPIAVQLNAED